MQKYVEQLLLDIGAEIGPIPVFKQRQEESESLYLSLEEDLQKAKFMSVENILGIPEEAFPPSSRLASFQIELLLNSLKWTMFKYGYQLNHPENASSATIYSVFKKNMTKLIPILEQNIWQLSFCGYDSTECPYGTHHCKCSVLEEMLSSIPFSSKNNG